MMWKRMKEVKKDQRGLTLIELLAVVVILGIIMAIAIPAIGGIIEKQKAKAHQANALMILDAAKMYFMDHPEAAGIVTTGTTGTSSEVTVKQLKDGKYLDAIPKNPFGADYVEADSKVEYNGGDLKISLSTGKNNNPDIGLVNYNGYTRTEVLDGKKATTSTP